MSQNGFVFWAQCKPNAKLEIYKIPDCRSFSVLKTLTGYRPYSHCVYLWLQQRKIKRVLNKVHFLNGWNPIASHLRRRMKTVKRLHLDGIQANSSIKTTGQEPGLLAPADLASLSQGPNPPKNFNFPQKVFGNNTKKSPFNQRCSTSDNMKTECSCLEKSPQTMCFGSCLCSQCRIKHPNEAKKCYCPSLCR